MYAPPKGFFTEILTGVFAHRGYSHIYPENTLEAFKQAALAGARAIEFDVQACKDGILFGYHDEDLARIHKDPRRIKELTRRELRSFSPPIPTLEQILDCAHENRLNVNLEIKTNHGLDGYSKKDAISLADKIFDLLQSKPIQSKFNPRENIIISSFDPHVIWHILPKGDTYPIAFLAERWEDFLDFYHMNHENLVHRHRLYSVHMDHEITTKTHVDTLKQMNLKTACYTVDSKERVDELRRMGVSAVFSNHANMKWEPLPAPTPALVTNQHDLYNNQSRKRTADDAGFEEDQLTLDDIEPWFGL